MADTVIIKRDFTFPSADGLTQIHAAAWEPEGAPRAILQITHGMSEYIERYAPFAAYLAGQGFLVVGSDHLGHGQSLCEAEGRPLGYFTKKPGADAVIADLHTLRTLTQERHPDLPYFMLGHSMGSFMIRRYAIDHGAGLAGVIVMGTGSQPGAATGTGKAVCRLFSLFGGWKKHSRLVDFLALGSNNVRFSKDRAGFDWLTKETAITASYADDPLCGFRFTLNGYYGMFDTIGYVQKKKHLARIPKELPLLLVSGEDDPVGAYGKGVRKAYEGFVGAGITDVSMKLYPTDRHEILNETDRAQVFDDLRVWMEQRV